MSATTLRRSSARSAGTQTSSRTIPACFRRAMKAAFRSAAPVSANRSSGVLRGRPIAGTNHVPGTKTTPKFSPVRKKSPVRRRDLAGQQIQNSLNLRQVVHCYQSTAPPGPHSATPSVRPSVQLGGRARGGVAGGSVKALHRPTWTCRHRNGRGGFGRSCRRGARGAYTPSPSPPERPPPYAGFADGREGVLRLAGG